MASTTLGTAWIQIKPTMKGVTSAIRSELSGVGDESGADVGQKFTSAFALKLGAISGIAQGVFSRVTSLISGQIDDAVNRSDVLNRFPKVMEMMGYSAEDAEGAITKLRDGVKGIPTPLSDVVTTTQQLAALTGDVGKSADWALAMSDAMLITTGDVGEMSRGMLQFMQILQRGKPLGNDWNTIMEVASPIMNELARSMGYTSAALGGDFYTALQNGTLSVEDMMGALVELDKNGGGGLESLRERVMTATGGIDASMTNMKQSISNALVGVIEEIGPENISNAILGIRDTLVGVVEVLGNVVTFITANWPVIQLILTTILTFFGTIGTIFAAKKVFDGLTGIFTLVTTNPILTMIAAIVTAVVLLITYWEDVKSVVEAVFGAIGEAIGTFANWVGGIFTGIWDTVTGVFSKLGEFFGNIFSTAWEKVKAVFSAGGRIFNGIKEGILNTFKTIVNGLIRGINTVVAIPFNGINAALRAIRGIDILGARPFGWISEIGVPQIPYLARGGAVLGAGTSTSDSIPAMLSNGEYVIRAAAAREIGYQNLDRMNRSGDIAGAGQTNYFTINGYNKSPEELANIISRKIAFNQRGVMG